MLQPFTIEQFGGLNLMADPFEVGATGAVDLVNVDFDQLGRVRCRDGYTQIKALTMTGPEGLAAYGTTTGTRQLVVGYTNGATKKYEAYGTAGGAAIASATPALTRISAVRFGAPGSEYLYIGNGSDTIWRWDGAAFTQPAGMPAGQYVAVDLNSNRLVTAVSALGASAVQWSDPGLPETWTASNFVHLAPGDGSYIEGLASWQGYVFAVKRNRFFVFYGESTDTDGLPIFNYNTVDGYGSLIPPVAGDEGVYFFDGRCVWLTTGGVPQNVSRPVEPFLSGLLSINGGNANQGGLVNTRLSYANGRLYVALDVSGGSTDGTLVYDPKIGQWTYYSLNMKVAVALSAANGQPFTYFLDTAGIGKFGNTVITDNAVAIAWSWKSGKYPLADPGRVAVTNESSLVGIGTVTLRLDSDLYTNQSASATLGAAFGDPVEGWPNPVDQEGTWLQMTLSGAASGSVSRAKHLVSFVRPAGAY